MVNVDIYIIFENNQEEYEDYFDWIKEIYFDKEKAKKRFFELIKTNRYTKDNKLKKVRYGRDIGAYRLEKHKIIDGAENIIIRTKEEN